MSTSTTDARDLFRQSIRTFQSVLKTGAELQEESARWLSQMANGLGTTDPWQKRSLAALDDVIARSKTNLDGAIRLMNENTEASLDLLRRAFGGCGAGENHDAAGQAQELWEAGLSALRTNVQALVEANARVAQWWGRMAASMANGELKESP